MRLLNTSTLQVQEFLESQVPEYVILSHTWREEEVTLQDLLSGIAPTKKGYAKLRGCCKKAKDDGFAYCWIDTCCIDKTSSAELSEAINSMYQWYKNACICYAYLEDVCWTYKSDEFKAYTRSKRLIIDHFTPFESSKWFTRGWTLQELIAPPIVEFYDTFWSEIGTRSSLQNRLRSITGINTDVLTGGNPLRYAVAVRLSWAARRKTSRLEDQAYCLFGILGVNMPLLYGEGKRAFRRLQEEMLRVDEDYTLFAWDAFSPTETLLASSPSEFETFTPVLDWVSGELSDEDRVFRRDHLLKTCFSVLPPPEDHSPPQLTSRGCRLSLPLLCYEKRSWYGCIARLERPETKTLLLCIMLRRVEGNENLFERDWDVLGERSTLVLVPMSASEDFTYASIYVTTSTEVDSRMPISRARDKDRLMLRIAMDPELRSHISRVSSNTVNARPFPTESAYTTETIAALPGMWSTCYAGRGNHNFRFRVIFSVSLDLIVDVHVDVDHNPWFTAWIERGGTIPVPWLTPTSPDRTLDRTTLRIQNPKFDEDFGWSIRLSIRRAGSTPLAPNTKQYVLTLTKTQP